MTSRDENLPSELARRNWIILAVLVVISLLWRSLPVTLGVVAGGLVVAVNYHWMGRSLRKLLVDQGQPPQGKFRSGRDFLLRMAVIGLVIYLLLVHTRIHPVGFAAGLSVYVLNLMLTAVKRLY
ncbi:MAG: ATP synthase subunit I [Desulfopila sp.]